MQVQELGDVLDLANKLDHMMFVQALMRTYFLLGVMAKVCLKSLGVHPCSA